MILDETKTSWRQVSINKKKVNFLPILQVEGKEVEDTRS
jgi:hypothetical protein